jgi:hypothetical protein
MALMLRIIFYTILVVLILSFFGVSIQSIVHSPTGQENFGYLGSLLVAVYDSFANLVTAGLDWLRHSAHA